MIVSEWMNKFNLVPSSACESIARLLYMYIINFINIIVMAKNIINEKDFKIIELSPDESFKLHFGYKNELNCYECNIYLNNEENVYYVAAINSLLCKKCFNEWYKNTQKFFINEEYEKHYYDIIMNIAKNYNINIQTINL